jgi:protease-4
VLFEIPPLMTGWVGAMALRRIIETIRAGGVKVAAYLPDGGGNREIWVASAADRVIVGPQAILLPLGLSIESRYLKPLLDKLGVSISATARGEYKTAAEAMTRETMSDEQREQLGALLDTLDQELRSALSKRPNIADDGQALFERGLLRGPEAVEAGLADAVSYDDELSTVLGTTEKPARLVPAAPYLAFAEARFFTRVLPRPYVGIVEVHGAIGAKSSGLGQGRGADPEVVCAALRAAGRDRFCVGVVLHVDSPGGSALASDQIHRDVVRLKEKKPVVTSMGNVAASGGYYVAAPTDVIFAEAVTITGSIGVVMARVVARELLDMVGVRTEILRRAPHADMFSPSREMTDAEQAILDRETDGFYRAFVSLVAAGRGLDYDAAEALARGRIWSGKDAQERGLVDRLGGLADAVDEVKKRAKVPSLFAGGVGARPVRPRRFPLPPAEPPGAAAALLALTEGSLGPVSAPLGEVRDVLLLLALLDGADRALYWAPGLPEVQ